MNTTAYYGLNNFYAFSAILERLASVLALDECDYTKVTDVPAEEVTVLFEEASFGWGFRISEDQTQAKSGRQITEKEDRTVIADMNLKLAHNDLLVVVGMVGCGKTTLLHSIMGETKQVTGSKTVKGTVAYVEQEPFIISASIRENILMGKKNNEELMEKALEAS